MLREGEAETRREGKEEGVYASDKRWQVLCVRAVSVLRARCTGEESAAVGGGGREVGRVTREGGSVVAGWVVWVVWVWCARLDGVSSPPPPPLGAEDRS